MVKLTSRLRTAADLCRRGVTVCDVGTDHALLACYLAQTGAKSVIASDVREGLSPPHAGLSRSRA